jgi:hypothetical protein
MKELEGLPTIHYSKMADLPASSPVHGESRTFRRELPRLLAEGHEGKWALIKGEAIIRLFDTFGEAADAGYEQFLQEPFLVQPIREWQPLLRVSRYCWPCHS